MLKRVRLKNTTLEELLVEDARRLRQQAGEIPPGSEREQLTHKARRAKHLQEWLTLPGLRPPT